MRGVTKSVLRWRWMQSDANQSPVKVPCQQGNWQVILSIRALPNVSDAQWMSKFNSLRENSLHKITGNFFVLSGPSWSEPGNLLALWRCEDAQEIAVLALIHTRWPWPELLATRSVAT
jgi:hypothetical protein